MNHVRKMLFGAAVALWAGLALAAEPPKSPVAVDIAKQPLREALAQFAQQTGLQVMLREEGLEAGKETAKSVRGKLAPREALEQLLEGTGLGYEFVTEKMIRISAARQTTRATEGEERIRMAQAGSAAGSADAAEGPASDEQKPGGVQLEEVVVTGTHIRGVVAAGSTLKVIRREEIERSGYSRVQDYFETLPQNFSGSAGEDVSTDSGATNFSRGQAVDLRGLGASSTLVLLNGKRQASGGLDASFVDISSIPLAFIDHIEVLSDGASALYGSDAIGGVVNFITRRDYDGFEASVRSGIISDAALEYGASLVGGRSWESGDIIAGYQFSRRDALEMADTPYGSQNKDFRKYGGDDLRVPGGAPGTIIDPFTFLPGFAIPAGQDGSSLTIDQLRPGQNNADNVTGNSALPRQIQHGLYFSTSYELSDSLRLVADGRFNHREMRLPSGDLTAFTIVPSTNPYFFDPYGLGAAFLWYSFSGLLGAPQIQFNNTNTLALSAGAEWKTGNEWRWNFFGSTARERNQWRTENSLDFIAIDSALNDTDPATALNLFGDPSFNDAATVDRLRLTSRGRGSSKVSSLSVVGDGRIFDAPAGTVRLAIGADYRLEDFDGQRSSFLPATDEERIGSRSIGNLDRSVRSVFGELALPLWSRRGAAQAPLEVNLSIAGRYEDYSDFGSTFDPRLGIGISLRGTLTFRGTWGTSFRAPRFNEISPAANPVQALLLTVDDPLDPAGFSDALVLLGNAEDLQAETADVWTAGFDYKSARLQGFSLSATYFNIKYADKIQDPGVGTATLLFAEEWADVIVRDPTPAEIGEVCELPYFVGACSATASAILDLRLRNISGLRTQGIDADIGYDRALAAGILGVKLSTTYTLAYERAATSSAPFHDQVNTVGNPLSWRARLTGSWDGERFGGNIGLNYANNYRDRGQNRPVNSWTTVDLGAQYRLSGSRTEGLKIAISATNVFDQRPPFVNEALFGFDPANANQMGRTLAVSLTKPW